MKTKFMAKEALLLLILVIILASCTSSKPVTLKEYLPVNKYDIQLNENPLIDKEFFQNDIKNSKVIFVGETHAVSKNYDISFALIKYLYENYGIRHIILEASYVKGLYFGEYVKTGDEKILDKVLDTYKGSYGYTKEHFDFWVNLHNYNKELPEDKKLSFIGVDLERISMARDFLLELKDAEVNTPRQINECLLLIKKIDRKKLYNPEGIKLVKEIKNYVQKYEETFKKYYGDSFFDFEFVINNLFNTVSACVNGYRTRGFDDIRENSIYDNFMKLYNPKYKYFAQFGRTHVYQSNIANSYKETNRFARRLSKETPELKNKVLTIVTLYKNCFNMNKVNYESQSVGDETPINHSYRFFKLVKEDFTLFKLNSKNSPFLNSSEIIGGPLDGGVTTDYFQYILVIRDSEACDPYEE